MTGENSDATPEVAPSKPAAPRVAPRTTRPEPIEADEADILAPNPGIDPEEIQPTANGPLFFDEPAEERPATGVAALGSAAASNAALNAGGAPTPLAGVPRVARAHTPDEELELGDDAPFTPTFATAPRAARPSDDEPLPELPASLPADLGSGPLYSPRFDGGDTAAPDAPDTAGDEPPGDGPADDAPVGERPARRPGRAWPLVLIGLLIIGALTYAVVDRLTQPVTVDIPAQSVVAPPKTNALDPIELTDASPFLAAMPSIAETWAMTAAETHDPDDARDNLGRVAEWHTLTYSDGTVEYTVEAYQLYSQEAARKALDKQQRDGDITEHQVLGAAVGAEARRSSEDRTRVLWTNGTAYFEAVGPSEGIDEFVTRLGL